MSHECMIRRLQMHTDICKRMRTYREQRNLAVKLDSIHIIDVCSTENLFYLIVHAREWFHACFVDRYKYLYHQSRTTLWLSFSFTGLFVGTSASNCMFFFDFFVKNLDWHDHSYSTNDTAFQLNGLCVVSYMGSVQCGMRQNQWNQYTFVCRACSDL